MSDTAQRVAVERLTELLAKATPGPWEVLNDIDSPYGDIRSDNDGEMVGRGTQKDIALIVAMRDALPSLLQQVAEQAAEIEELQSLCESSREQREGAERALDAAIDRAHAAERAREEANMVWRVALVGVVEAALIHDGMDHLEANVKANAQADRIAAFLAANGGKDGNV